MLLKFLLIHFLVWFLADWVCKEVKMSPTFLAQTEVVISANPLACLLQRILVQNWELITLFDPEHDFAYKWSWIKLQSIKQYFVCVCHAPAVHWVTWLCNDKDLLYLASPVSRSKHRINTCSLLSTSNTNWKQIMKLEEFVL